jgi:hypothetical protein
MKSSTKLSLPQSMTVRGYEIKRLPLGKYLQAIQALEGMPETVMRACFPDMNPAQALEALKHIDTQALSEMMMRCALAVPREAVRLISLLTGIEEGALLDDPEIGLDGLAEMASAFWKLNNMENFIKAARTLFQQIRAAVPVEARTGSNG